MASLNGIGKTDAYMWRYDSTLLAKVLWDGGGGGAAGSTQVSVSTGNVQTLPQSTVWAGNAGFHFDVSGNLLTAGGAGGSSQVTISRVQDGADNPVFIGDSTNNAVRVNVVAGAAGGSTTVNVSSLAGKVTVDQNSTVWQAQVSSLAGRVLTDQNSTVWAVQMSQYSTTAQVSSVGGVVTVQQNSTTFAVQLSNYSTTVQVSSLAGTVNVQQASTGNWSVLGRNTDGLGNLIESSTRAAGTNSTMRGLAVRSIRPESTFATGQASSAETQLVSSAATQIHVYAYSLCPLTTGANLIRFLSGSTQELWRERLLGTSTQYPAPPSGLSMSVAPPSWLFRTAASQPLLLSATSSGVNYSLSFWRE